MAGLAKEMQQAVVAANRVASRSDIDLVRVALICCQDRFNQLSNRFYSEPNSFEWLDDLHTLAQRRGGEWATWAQGVQDALKPCPPQLYDVGQTLFDCWQELVERVVGLT